MLQCSLPCLFCVSSCSFSNGEKLLLEIVNLSTQLLDHCMTLILWNYPPIRIMLSISTSACDYHSGAGSRGHRSVSTPSEEIDQQLRREEYPTGRCSAASSFPHTLSHLEPFPILLHSTTHGGPPAGVLQPDHWKGTVTHLCVKEGRQNKRNWVT